MKIEQKERVTPVAVPSESMDLETKVQAEKKVPLIYRALPSIWYVASGMHAVSAVNYFSEGNNHLGTLYVVNTALSLGVGLLWSKTKRDYKNGDR